MMNIGSPQHQLYMRDRNLILVEHTIVSDRDTNTHMNRSWPLSLHLAEPKIGTKKSDSKWHTSQVKDHWCILGRPRLPMIPMDRLLPYPAYATSTLSSTLPDLLRPILSGDQAFQQQNLSR